MFQVLLPFLIKTSNIFEEVVLSQTKLSSDVFAFSGSLSATDASVTVAVLDAIPALQTYMQHTSFSTPRVTLTPFAGDLPPGVSSDVMSGAVLKALCGDTKSQLFRYEILVIGHII